MYYVPNYYANCDNRVTNKIIQFINNIKSKVQI